MEKRSYYSMLLIVLLFLVAPSAHAQKNWVSTQSSESTTKFYSAKDFDTYSFVGTSTFFGAEFKYEKSGAIITEIHSTSPASDFNFKLNDVVTTIGKFKILSEDEYEKALAFYKPLDEVSVSYIRDGEERSRIVVLGKINVFKSEKAGKKLELPTGIHANEVPEKIKVLETNGIKNQR